MCDPREIVLPGEAPLGAPCTVADPVVSPPSDPAANVPVEGEIIVTGRQAIKADPLAEINAQSYEAVTAVDDAIVAPVANVYSKGLPKPVRKGLSNFFANLREPVVFINDMLQLRPKRAVRTLGRFVINSTVGVAGLVDVAKKKPFHLPRRNNGFANTLAYYGVGPGPFLVVPLLGATTLRDALGGAADTMVLPNIVGKPFNRFEYAASSYVVTSLDQRLALDEEIQRIRASNDPYAAMRDVYMRRRAAEIAALKAPGNGIPEPVEVPEPARR